MSLLASLSLVPAHPLPLSGLLSWMLPVMESHSMTCPCLPEQHPGGPPRLWQCQCHPPCNRNGHCHTPLELTGKLVLEVGSVSQAPSMVLGEGWPSPVMGSSDNSRHKPPPQPTADCWREVQEQVLPLRICCPGHLHLNLTQTRGTGEEGTPHKIRVSTSLQSIFLISNQWGCS